MATPPPIPPQQQNSVPVLPYGGSPAAGGGPPCPRCGHYGHQRVSFTWWGGLIGPKILSHVKCNACRSCFNGKTGQSNTTGIIIYSVVLGVIAIGVLVLFALLR